MSSVTGGPRPDMQAGGVSWNEAARFVNWAQYQPRLSSGLQVQRAAWRPSGYDANANIELWVNEDAGFDPANWFRNSEARYFLPSATEWYKAAYYDSGNRPLLELSHRKRHCASFIFPFMGRNFPD